MSRTVIVHRLGPYGTQLEQLRTQASRMRRHHDVEIGQVRTQALADGGLEQIQAQAAPFVALRHDLHRHPELGLKEFRTSALLAEQLQGWGYTVTRGLEIGRASCRERVFGYV